MKKIISLVLVMLMMVAAVACGGGGSTDDPTTSPTATSGQTSSPSTSSSPDPTDAVVAPSGDEQYGGVLRIVSSAEGATPIGLPWEIFGIDVVVLPPYAESLLVETASGIFYPWLAEEYWIDADTLQIFFKIREGVYFHDGSYLNAEVVRWNYQMAKDDDALNPAIIDIQAVDEYLVMMQLDRWQNTLWAGFASHSFAIISKENADINGIDYARENPVGTGAFAFKEYIRGEKIVYEKFDRYWQEGKPYLDGIEFVFMRDVMTQNIAFQSTGDQSIDVLGTNSAEQVIMHQGPGVYVAMNPIGPVSLVPSSFDEESPLSDVRVRQAISYAIDRDAIVAARGFGLMTPATQFIPEEWEEIRLPDSYNFTFNPDRARELLVEAGYPDGFSSTIYGMPGMADRDGLVAVQAMLRDVGINVEVEFPDSGGYSDLRFGGWDGLMAQHTRSFAQASLNFSMYFGVSEDPANPGGLRHTTMISAWRPYEEMYNAAQEASRAPEADPELLQVMHRIIMDNMMCIPLWNIFEFYIMNENIRDTGYAEWSSNTIFMPQDAWIANN